MHSKSGGYLRAVHERAEARKELAASLSQLAHKALSNEYGPLISVFSEQAFSDLLNGLEFQIARARGDMYLVFSEILNRSSDFCFVKKVNH
jgi:hypothetical protein